LAGVACCQHKETLWGGQVGKWVRGNRSGSVSFGQGAQVSYLVS